MLEKKKDASWKWQWTTANLTKTYPQIVAAGVGIVHLLVFINIPSGM